MKLPDRHVPGAVRDRRTPGWLAQWQESLLDKEQKIARPRQVYIGSPQRDYVPIESDLRRREAPPHMPTYILLSNLTDDGAKA